MAANAHLSNHFQNSIRTCWPKGAKFPQVGLAQAILTTTPANKPTCLNVSNLTIKVFVTEY
eukprot:6125444-Amphidinium_carterae.1